MRWKSNPFLSVVVVVVELCPVFGRINHFTHTSSIAQQKEEEEKKKKKKKKKREREREKKKKKKEEDKLISSPS